MKSEKAITLMSLVLSVLLMLIILAILSVIIMNIKSNIKYEDQKRAGIEEINKFNMYFLQEVKKQGNKIESISQNNITFSSNNKYSYKNNGIYLNDDIEIAKDIISCVFNKNMVNGKTIIEVTLKTGDMDKKIEYVLNDEQLISNYEDEESYVSTTQ